MSGCGCQSSTQTFPKVPRSLSQCGTSMGLAEPSLLGEPLSPCLANMGESNLSLLFVVCYSYNKTMQFFVTHTINKKDPQWTFQTPPAVFFQHVPAGDAWPESLAGCGGGRRGTHHHTGTHQQQPDRRPDGQARQGTVLYVGRRPGPRIGVWGNCIEVGLKGNLEKGWSKEIRWRVNEQHCVCALENERNPRIRV